MSDTDKTRQKLVNSMRKSKNAGTTGPAPKTGATKKRSPDKSPAKTKKPAAATPRVASKQAGGATAKSLATTGRARPADSDPYQSAGRVWPD